MGLDPQHCKEVTIILSLFLDREPLCQSGMLWAAERCRPTNWRNYIYIAVVCQCAFTSDRTVTLYYSKTVFCTQVMGEVAAHRLAPGMEHSEALVVGTV
jgi:hypothetical protein